MASLGLLRLPVHLCVFVPFFLLVCISIDMTMLAECSSELRSDNITDFEAYDNLKMVTTPLGAPPPEQTSFYYILALQWPPSQCSSKHCKRGFTVPRIFTIHGLWPNWENGDSPQYCFPDNKFDFSQVRTIAKDLDTYWPSLFDSRTQQAFLGNEWAKHGTSSDLSQFDYFNTALILATPTKSEDINVLNRLSALGYVPHATKKYSPSEIVAKYQERYKQVIKIICIRKRNSADEMIGEIYFKINKDGKTVEPIGDKDKTRGCTKASVLFPDRDKNKAYDGQPGNSSRAHHLGIDSNPNRTASFSL